MTTIEELQEMHNSLVYFKDDLTVVDNDVDWSEVRNNPEYLLKFTNEILYINRMNTIAREREWRARNSGSEFQANLMYERITHPNAITNEYGEIDSWGSKLTPEEFELYTKHYDEVFITEYIDDSI